MDSCVGTGKAGNGMSRSNVADRCECGYEDDLPATLPYSVIYTDNDSLRADYHCFRCGRRWYTSWGAYGAGWPMLAPVIGASSGRPTLEQLP